MLLPKMAIVKAPYFVGLQFGFSNNASDIDNPVKPLLDILQKKYKWFNDKNIRKMYVEKILVKKGDEYINFLILPYDLPR